MSQAVIRTSYSTLQRYEHHNIRMACPIILWSWSDMEFIPHTKKILILSFHQLPLHWCVTAGGSLVAWGDASNNDNGDSNSDNATHITRQLKVFLFIVPTACLHSTVFVWLKYFLVWLMRLCDSRSKEASNILSEA